MTMQLRQFGFYMLAITAIMIGCTNGSSNAEAPVTFGGGSQRLPSKDVQDIVSYADQLSVFSVVSESEIQPPEEVFERGEGYIGRKVTIRIEQNLWNRGPIAEAKGDIELTVQGWTLHDNERRLFSLAGAPRLEVGKRYVGPLVLLSGGRFGDGEWSVFAPWTTLRLEGDRTVRSEVVVGITPEPVAVMLTGKSLGELAQLFGETQPDPFSLQYAELDPESRYILASQARRTSGE